MSKIANAISDYIVESVALGFEKNSEICLRAKKKIEEIDDELNRAFVLREEKQVLKGILMHLGDPDYSKNEAEPIKLSDDDPEISELKKRICGVLSSGPLTNREVMSKLGNNHDSDAKVIRALKLLGNDEIVQRDGTSDNKIIHGPKWMERPQ